MLHLGIANSAYFNSRDQESPILLELRQFACVHAVKRVDRSDRGGLPSLQHDPHERYSASRVFGYGGYDLVESVLEEAEPLRQPGWGVRVVQTVGERALCCSTTSSDYVLPTLVNFTKMN